MKIKVNSNEVEVTGLRVLIEELRDMGLQIPSLCYAPDANHQASCMVCMVKDVASGQMIPSCSTFPREGMEIDTESEEVMELRKMSLELLLSDHPARCGVCEGKAKCKLRELAIQMKAKWTRFGPPLPTPLRGGVAGGRGGVSSAGGDLQSPTRIHVNGRLYFEPAKCIRCGLCVYNSDDGFTFQHRGFNMQVIIPDESKPHIDECLADLCPTGALILLCFDKDNLRNIGI